MRIIIMIIFFIPKAVIGQAEGAVMNNFSVGQLISKNEITSINSLPLISVEKLPALFSYSATLNFPRDSVQYTGQGRRFKDGAGGMEYTHFKLSENNLIYKGYFIGSYLGKDLLRQNYLLDLEGAVGLNWGRRSLIILDKYSRYNNTFFAPKIVVTVRLKLWRVVLFGKIDYQYDVTDSSWKWKEGDVQNIEDSKFNALMIFGGIGFNISQPR